MQSSAVQTIKLAIVAATGLEKDALHVYVGLAVFFGVGALSRRRLRSAAPWLSVLAVAIVGEIVDMIDDLSMYGHWNWTASVHDVANTLFWPTVICLLVRFGVVFENV